MPVHGATEAPSPSESSNSQEGRRFGEWVVRRHIASGGFGEVYEVEQAGTARRGALKLLRSELASERDAVLRFEREALVLRSLSIPGIAAVYDVSHVAGNEPFLVMELLEGESLSTRLRERGRIAPQRALEIVDAVATVLDAAHASGVVHRDVKASNVFLTKDPAGDERVVVLDFGLGKLLDNPGPELTGSRQILGSPASMAPEQIVGGRIDGRTDVYGLGALAFSMLTGRPPFEHESCVVLCQLHLHARIPSVSALAPVPPALDSVLARAMSKAPEHRYATCRRFAAALREAIEGSAEPRRTTVGVVSVRVSADPLALSEGDVALLDDFERVPALAARALETAGLTLALRTGDGVAFFREIPTAFREALRAGRGLRALSRELRRSLADRADAHDAVRVEIRCALGQGAVRGSHLVASDALNSTFAAPHPGLR